MNIILFIIILCIFNVIAQTRNREVIKLNYGKMYFKELFVNLRYNIFNRYNKTIFVNVNEYFLRIFKYKRSSKDIVLNDSDKGFRIRKCQCRYLISHDQLTGVYNRKFFEEQLKRLDIQSEVPLAVVMGDINGLKSINDSFGYLEGDKLLKRASEVIKRACSREDIIARLGGDEFIILLPKTNQYEAEQTIKRIKRMALKEETGLVNIDMTFGYAVKNNTKENLEKIVKKAEDSMYKRKLMENLSIRSKTINIIINALYEKNKREENHSRRVSELCKSMGKALGLSECEIRELKIVGLLHDIGKIAVEECILNKKGKLTDDEWERIKKHPEIGYRILSTVNDMSQIAKYVLAHHEKWNGTGYPKCLKEREIPFQSRIITILDSYDAMTSERSYGSALSEQAAIKELQKNACIQFDPELVRVFIEKVLNRHFLLK